ncbi:hypothetical protein SPAB_03550 [Salmonella enterica subsp. enterica serovar Paratyphi B str. SPB7]|uniref:Uncharacterized protein n=1 Tax=Salmonella paratyphi B (strain ATCC BAA-1250 / SPB7) TaxID=1016998 RepID=A0A6C6Z6N9_SALPB|nr:hypothetical protein SPAB_03550 [Salmonella enterica subsp. enterica serovar Paratyphi B str. SPB7]
MAEGDFVHIASRSGCPCEAIFMPIFLSPGRVMSTMTK